MTLHPIPKTPSPLVPSLDPITASRFAHAASRKVSGNLFRLLAEMSADEQPAITPTEGGGDGGSGPPWDEDQTEALTTAAASAPDTAKPDAA